MAAVYVAVFLIYNIIVMLLFSGKNSVFWISYVFMTVSWGVNLGIALNLLRERNVEATFFGIPLLSLSVFYFFGELFISFVFMLFRTHASVKLAMAIQVIFMLLFIIMSIAALAGKNAVETINNTVETNARNIKSLAVDVQMLENQCLDRELKNELHKVYEAIRYSDPMVTDAVADLDNIISGKISELRYNCQSSNKAEALQICYQLNSYISERNARLLISK